MFRIPRYSGKVVEKKKKMEKTANAKRFAFQANAKND